ncbi:sensor histidine kinase [Clostridium swellfunianum]|uniref:sensor histidine kinase n=1 Tax=Clostridium swellfunianum TaxID=1367462 RepID=UPI00202FA5A4|nr:sensor histidine kinase [Clostridium swellfunianum]MCM0649353.1 sensor histidine kinase [Clostridium swellfunianum]
MIKFSFKKSLEKKIILFGIILSLISIGLTTITCYFVTNRFILSQFERVNEIATGAAVEKANTYLGEFANIVSMSMKNQYFDSIISSNESDPYVLIKAQKDYESFLKNLILSNDKVDAVLVVDYNRNIFIKACNSVGKYYEKYGAAEFYNNLNKPLLQNSKSQFFLDRYKEGNYERLAIISPVFEPYSNEIKAYMVVVLSKKLIEEMQFAGNGIFITDNAGNSAELTYNVNDDELTGQKFSFKNALNYEGWTITNTFTFDKLQESINKNLTANIKIGIVCLILSVVILTITGKKIVKPIKNMEAQISELNHSYIENKPIVFFKRNIGFKLTLLILYCTIVTVPVVLITGSSYFSARNTVENKVGSVFEYSAQILYQQMQFVYNNYRRMTIETSSFNEKVQKLLDVSNSSNNLDNEIRDEMNNIILSRNLFDKGISNITIYDTEERLVYSSTYGGPFMMRPDTKADLDYVRNNFSAFLWRSYTESPFNKKGIRIGMQIRGAADGIEAGKLLGFILIDFNGEDIEKMLNVFLKYSYLDLYLVDRTGNNIFSDIGSSDKKGLSDILIFNKPSFEKNERISFRENGNNYLMISKYFDENQWSLVFLLKNFNENENILVYSVIVLIGLVILSFGFSYGFSSILSLNISSLIKIVRNVKRGNLKTRFKSTAEDEISELGNSFNDMLDRINLLIEEKYTSEVKIKDAEIKAKEYELNLLQSQINPHFLYNTLKTAQYMAFIKDPRTEQMIKLLIALFKTSITRGEKIVRFGEEMAHVKTYVDIQKMRFGDKIKVIYDVSDDMMETPVLKLTLQPIVENAIYHGLEVTEDGGTIIVAIHKLNDRLKISVSDDGAGMSKDKLSEIKERLEGKTKGQSIGIINVHERIKLYFGDEYGIEIDSILGKGAVVTINFPLLDQQGYNLT